MIIHGREVHFQLTTGAMRDIAQSCPENDIQKIRTAMDNTVEMLDTIAKMAAAMSKWYELKKAFETAGYKGIALTYEECMVLDPDEFQELATEVMQAFVEGQKTEIETEPVKKKE